MIEPVAIPAAPKKAKGIWTPWGQFRVPDLDVALDNKSPNPAKRKQKAAPAEPDAQRKPGGTPLP